MSHLLAESNHSKTLLGFWIYLMTDCVLFATLFATYVVLKDNVFGGPTAKELFNIPYVLAETLCLLVSSFACGLIMLSIKRNSKKGLLIWFTITFLLGAAFVGLELAEFMRLVAEGNSWTKSAFLSSYFTLVGTHGAHVSVGLLWMIVLMVLFASRGFTPDNLKKFACFRLFWHFLDIVWIFIFTIVYLMGASS